MRYEPSSAENHKTRIICITGRHLHSNGILGISFKKILGDAQNCSWRKFGKRLGLNISRRAERFSPGHSGPFTGSRVKFRYNTRTDRLIGM